MRVAPPDPRTHSVTGPYEPGAPVRERETRWSPVTGKIVGFDIAQHSTRVVVNWRLNGRLVAIGSHDPANLEPAT